MDSVIEIKLKKWGNSLGLRIPHKLAISWGLDETTIVDLVETEQGVNDSEEGSTAQSGNVVVFHSSRLYVSR